MRCLGSAHPPERPPWGHFFSPELSDAAYAARHKHRTALLISGSPSRSGPEPLGCRPSVPESFEPDAQRKNRTMKLLNCALVALALSGTGCGSQSSLSPQVLQVSGTVRYPDMIGPRGSAPLRRT